MIICMSLPQNISIFRFRDFWQMRYLNIPKKLDINIEHCMIKRTMKLI